MRDDKLDTGLPDDDLTPAELRLLKLAEDGAVAGMDLDPDAAFTQFQARIAHEESPAPTGPAPAARRPAPPAEPRRPRAARPSGPGSPRPRTTRPATAGFVRRYLIVAVAIAVLMGGALFYRALVYTPRGSSAALRTETTAPATSGASFMPSLAAPLTGSFALSARRVDDRTVEIDVTPPAELTPNRVYWFFVEVHWGNGVQEYYPRHMLTGDAQTLSLTLPKDADLSLLRVGRVYSLTPAQSAEAEKQLQRQATGNDYFPYAVGDPTSPRDVLP